VARIRTIKPGFFTNEGLSEVSEPAQILAGGLLCYADDEGYFNAHPALVKAAVFPLREPSKPVSEMLKELATIRYVRFGTGKDGRRYGHIVNFSEHQKVSHPIASKIKTLSIVWEISGSAPEDSGNIPEESAKPPEVLRPELNGIELNGIEQKGIEPSGENQLPSAQEKPQEQIIELDRHSAATTLGAMIGMASSGYNFDALVSAIDQGKRRWPGLRNEEVATKIDALWKEYVRQPTHIKQSLKNWLDCVGRYIDSDDWKVSKLEEFKPQLDEYGGHYEHNGPQRVYVTKDGKRMPGYIPPPKAKGAAK